MVLFIIVVYLKEYLIKKKTEQTAKETERIIQSIEEESAQYSDEESLWTQVEKELQDAKTQLIGQYVLALETNLDKAGALAMYEATGRGFEFIEQYEKLIQSVTSKDVREVANKYFNGNYVESIVDKAK